MSLEMTVLQLLKHRKSFSKIYRNIAPGTLNSQTEIVLRDYEAYFKEHPDVETIQQEPYLTWIKLVRKAKQSPEQLAIYTAIVGKIKEDPPESIKVGLMDKLNAADAANQMNKLITSWNAGEEVDLKTGMEAIMKELEANTVRKVKSAEVTMSIDEMLSEDNSDHGLRWRLEALNASMRPLRGGDFGIIAGRPDTGKTSFLTSELTFMASQLADIYPDEDRSIIWLNNEGPGKRIKYRCYQSALNMTTSEMVEANKQGKLHDAYNKAVGGANRIRVFDIHDWWNYEVRDLLDTLKPGLIVFDMVDNIKFGGDVSNNGQRTDQLLEAMYQWSRLLAVLYDVPILATSQISAAGDGLSYPTLSMLKDSQTGKQGAAEFIITLGKLNDITMTNDRFIGMTKNKLHREGGPRDPRAQVVFDGLRGRYT